jgi:hypothetical protein
MTRMAGTLHEDQYTFLIIFRPIIITMKNVSDKIFSTEFRKAFKYQISLKPVQWEPRCSMRTDGRTDRHDEINSRF